MVIGCQPPCFCLAVSTPAPVGRGSEALLRWYLWCALPVLLRILGKQSSAGDHSPHWQVTNPTSHGWETKPHCPFVWREVCENGKGVERNWWANWEAIDKTSMEIDTECSSLRQNKKIELEKQNCQSQTVPSGESIRGLLWFKEAWVLLRPFCPLPSAIIFCGRAGMVRIAHTYFIFLHTSRGRAFRLVSWVARYLWSAGLCAVHLSGSGGMLCAVHAVSAVALVGFRENVMCEEVRVRRNDSIYFRLQSCSQSSRLTTERVCRE